MSIRRERVLSKGERAVLEWLEKHHGQSELGLSNGPHFSGWVYEAPRVQAATFLNLLERQLIQPTQNGWGAPMDVKMRDDDAEPEATEQGNVVRMWAPGMRTKLARWFFRLSQLMSTGSLVVEPYGFVLILAGPEHMEVLVSGLHETQKRAAVAALTRHFKPERGGLAYAYEISERGRAMLDVSRFEDRIEAEPVYLEQHSMRIERIKMLQAMPKASR